jgi:hypothetical protein
MNIGGIQHKEEQELKAHISKKYGMETLPRY